MQGDGEKPRRGEGTLEGGQPLAPIDPPDIGSLPACIARGRRCENRVKSFRFIPFREISRHLQLFLGLRRTLA